MVRDTLCTYCRSNYIIWDYERGDIICGNCGAVLEKIYLNGVVKHSVSTAPFKHDHKYPLMSKHTKLYLKLMERASRYGLVVDNEVVMKYFSGKAPLIKVFKQPNSVSPELTNDERVKIVMNIVNKYPRLASRTERAKYALAKIALAMVMNKLNYLNIRRMKDELNISEVHLRRLLKIINENHDFLREVMNAITLNSHVQASH